jgi:hypothetical protein
MIRWIGAEFGESCNLLQLTILQPFECNAEERNLLVGARIAHHAQYNQERLLLNYKFFSKMS